MDNGWICLHRKMLDWEWFDDKNTFRLFMVLLMLTNHKSKKWRGIDIVKGSFLTSLDSLSVTSGLTVQQVRTSLSKLKSTSEITIKTTSKYSIVSIANWDSYQDNNKQDNKQVTNKQQTNNKQVTTTNNVNNENKENKRDKSKSVGKNKKAVFTIPPQSEIIEYSVSKKLNTTGFFDYYESNGWMVGKNKMKDWKAAARNWSSRQHKFSGNNNQPKSNQATRKPSADFIKQNPRSDESVLDGEFTRMQA